MLAILTALDDEIAPIKNRMSMDKIIRIRPFTVYIGKFDSVNPVRNGGALNPALSSGRKNLLHPSPPQGAGLSNGVKIAVTVAGIGKGAMSRAVSYCIENLRPSMLINTGYCGGLDPRLSAGDMVIATSLCDESDQIITADKDLAEKAAKACASAGLRQKSGRIVTVVKPITDPHGKAFAGTKFEAIACDMESFAFAMEAEKKHIPYIVVRAVLDPMDTALTMTGSVTPEGKTDVGEIILKIASDPKSILDLPRLSFLANTARTAIAGFIKEWIKTTTTY